MAVNYILSGATPKTDYVLNSDAQDSRVLLTFPYTNDGIHPSEWLAATADRVSPVTTKHSESKTGIKIPGFAVDWYERIHITPISVNVGNLLSEQVRDIFVWNAYFESKQLTQILESVDSGIELIQPKPLPVTFSPLEVLIYQLRVGVNGPPIVSGSFIFDFSFVQITVVAGGQRVVIVPFRPLQDVNESLEWKTDVIRAKAKEQRIALRDAPRQVIEYQYMMEDRQVSLSRAMFYGWANRQFGVPIWFEMTYVGTITAGSTTIIVDTTTTEYRVNYPALVWTDDEHFEALNVIAVNEGSIEFFVGPASTYEKAYVCPVRYGRTVSGISYRRGSHNLIQSGTTFNILQNADIGATAGLTTHDGLDVLTDIMYDLGSHDERVERKVTIIDNDLGIPVADALYTTTDETFSLGFVAYTRAELQRIRKWIHLRKGRAKTFWLPTVSNDLELVANIEAGSIAIDVRSVQYPLYYTTRTIQIVRKNGVKTYHNVVGGTTVGQVDTLSLSATISETALIADVKYINFMYRVRFDSDRIELKHGEAGYVTIRIPVKEVPA